MQRILSILALSLTLSAAVADDGIRVLNEDLTSADLTSGGAVLTDADSILWPNGLSANVSYWLGAGDVTYRCAEIRGADSPQSSCWRWEPVITEAILPEGSTRTISTRRRPVLPYWHDPTLSRSRLWIGVSGER